jgi:hypothetical protein
VTKASEAFQLIHWCGGWLHAGKVIRHNRNPRMRAHRADNNEMALIALKSLGITSVGYSAQGTFHAVVANTTLPGGLTG